MNIPSPVHKLPPLVDKCLLPSSGGGVGRSIAVEALAILFDGSDRLTGRARFINGTQGDEQVFVIFGMLREIRIQRLDSLDGSRC